ncbi:MAG: glycine cleavage system aminomethyltransferase GcvT, partial [Planctomycetota bacterium]
TNENGGILDDILVYHLPTNGGSQFMMVVNASNRRKIKDWILEQNSDSSFDLHDRTTNTSMIACQGPNANELVAGLSDFDPSQLKYYTGVRTTICGHEAVISRTGYTGEDGCEIIVDNQFARSIWEELHTGAIAVRGAACGLAARDTLRLEAAMPLYGHELGETINPVQADLGFAINLKNRDFIGKAAILAAREGSDLTTRIGLELEGKRAAREGCKILIEDQVVGEITSGTFSPTLQKSISMGYINSNQADVGTEVTIDIRGKAHPGRIVALPFYKRT